MSELYPVLILNGLSWLLMARFTPHSRADVAQKLVEAASPIARLASFLFANTQSCQECLSDCWGTANEAPLAGCQVPVGLVLVRGLWSAVILVREQRENRNQQLAFHASPFVLCGLPLRRPPKSQLVHVRHSGNFFLHVTAHPDFGLPFGQDRLIPIWVATLALQQNNRTIHFESAAQMLEFFRLPKDGPHYERPVRSEDR